MTYRLYLHAPNVVFTARVNQSEFDYPIAAVAYDGGVTFDDVLADYTVFFGTSAGADDLGRQRLRAGSTIGASGTLKFGRSSTGVMDGSVKLENDAYITVFEDRRPWGIFPNEDGFPSYKDQDIAAGDYMDESPPKANAGKWHAASLAGGTSIVVAFDGSASFATAAGASITGYLWNVDDGQVTIGNLTDAQITAQFPVGFRYVSLTVTDSNGKTHTAYVGVYCRDPNSDATIQDFEVLNLPDSADGQELDVRILDDIPASTYPDGTLVMLWEGEPSGPSDRDHVKFVGWHQRDPAQITGEKTGTLKDTVLHCVDIGGAMKRLPAYTQVISRRANTGEYAGWSLVDPDNAHMDWFLWYLLHWHSTVLQLTDWTWSGTTTDFPFVVMGADGQNLWDQVQSRARALVPDYHMTCNRNGQLRVIVDPMLQDAGDRTSTVQAALDEDDILDIRWEGQNYPRINQLQGNAILASTSDITPIFCLAPGTARSQGLDEHPSGEQLARSQADLNAAEGHRYARLNAPYGMFTVVLAGDAVDIEPADLTWVTLSISAEFAAQRGLTFTNARGLVHQVTPRIERRKTGTVKTYELQWELETVGIPAVTEIVEADDYPSPDWDPGDDGYDPDPGPGGDGLGTLYIMTGDTLGRTRDVSVSSPSYSDITPAGATALWDFVLDPWSPSDTGYLVAIEGVYKSTDLDLSTPSWTLVLSAAEILTGSSGTTLRSNFKIVAAITEQDYLWLSYAVDSYESWVAKSVDGGANWTHVQVATNLGNLGNDTGAFDVVPHGSAGNHILFKADGGSFGRIYRSNDDGDSWTLVKAFPSGKDYQAASCLHCPYHNNSDGRVLYIGFDNGSHKSTDGGVTSTIINGDAATSVKRTGIETFTGDSDIVVHWKNDNTMWISTDGASSFTRRSATGLSGTLQGTGGFPSESGRYYALTSTGIFISTDGGQTFTNKTGDWAFGFSFPSDRMGVIVPLWVEE